MVVLVAQGVAELLDWPEAVEAVAGEVELPVDLGEGERSAAADERGQGRIAEAAAAEGDGVACGRRDGRRPTDERVAEALDQVAVDPRPDQGTLRRQCSADLGDALGIRPLFLMQAVRFGEQRPAFSAEAFTTFRVERRSPDGHGGSLLASRRRVQGGRVGGSSPQMRTLPGACDRRCGPSDAWSPR